MSIPNSEIRTIEIRPLFGENFINVPWISQAEERFLRVEPNSAAYSTGTVVYNNLKDSYRTHITFTSSDAVHSIEVRCGHDDFPKGFSVNQQNAYIFESGGEAFFDISCDYDITFSTSSSDISLDITSHQAGSFTLKATALPNTTNYSIESTIVCEYFDGVDSSPYRYFLYTYQEYTPDTLSDSAYIYVNPSIILFNDPQTATYWQIFVESKRCLQSSNSLSLVFNGGESTKVVTKSLFATSDKPPLVNLTSQTQLMYYTLPYSSFILYPNGKQLYPSSTEECVKAINDMSLATQ